MRVKPIYAFIVKEFKHVYRDKSTLFWVFAWPIFWIIISAAIFAPMASMKPVTLKTGVVNNDSSQTPFNGTLFVKILNETKYQDTKLFKVIEYDNITKLVRDVRENKLDLGIVIPEGFGNNTIYDTGVLTIYVYAGDVQKEQMIHGMMSKFLEYLSTSISKHKIEYTVKYIPENVGVDKETIVKYLYSIAKPINATFKEVKPKTLIDRGGVLGWYTFGAIGMVMLYTGFSIGSLMIRGEKDWGTLDRILASPATPYEILIGKTLGGVITLALAALASILAGVAVGARILWNPFNPVDWLLILDLFLTAIFTIGVGLIISIFSRSSSGAQGLSVVLGLMLSFLTGIWIPKWILPPWLAILSDYFPGTWGIDVMRDIVVFRKGLEYVVPKIIYLGISSTAVYLIGVLIYRVMIRSVAEA